MSRVRSLLRRFLDRLIESRQRAAEREIGRLLQRRGVARLTDELEREISRRRWFGKPSGE
jgi:hypothetical protein